MMDKRALERSVDLVRLCCQASAAYFGGGPLPGIERFGLTPADMQFLLRENFDSAIYLPYAPQSELQLIYDELWRVQCEFEREVAGALRTLEARWAIVQGLEAGWRAFAGQAFSRRGDVDILIEPSSVPDLEAALRAIGLAQRALDESTHEVVEIDAGLAARIEQTQYFEKKFSFSKICALRLPDHAAALITDRLTPVYRSGADICAFLSAEPVFRYAGAMTAASLLEHRDPGSPDGKYLTPTANFLISAVRLIDGLRHGDNKLRLLCELCVRQGLAFDHRELTQLARQWRVEDQLAQALALIDFAMGRKNASKAPPLLADYLSQR
jgi:hypothetical protein